MSYPTQEELRQLSPEERMRLIDDLWGMFLSEPDLLPLEKSDQDLLEQRMAEYERDPQGGSSWAAVRQRIASRT